MDLHFPDQAAAAVGSPILATSLLDAPRPGEEGNFVGTIVLYRSCWWGTHSTFGVIVKETPRTVSIAHLLTRLVSGDWQNGVEVPEMPDYGKLDALTPAAFRALKVRHMSGVQFHHKGRSFRRWDGKPQFFCSD